MKKIVINVSRFPIRLGQFLKHACVVSDGVEGKTIISNGDVSVNGKPEFRRGKQLSPGDSVVVGDTSYTCTAQDT
jgi:ribosome-associated protein